MSLIIDAEAAAKHLQEAVRRKVESLPRRKDHFLPMSTEPLRRETLHGICTRIENGCVEASKRWEKAAALYNSGDPQLPVYRSVKDRGIEHLTALHMSLKQLLRGDSKIMDAWVNEQLEEVLCFLGPVCSNLDGDPLAALASQRIERDDNGPKSKEITDQFNDLVWQHVISAILNPILSGADNDGQSGLNETLETPIPTLPQGLSSKRSTLSSRSRWIRSITGTGNKTTSLSNLFRLSSNTMDSQSTNVAL